MTGSRRCSCGISSKKSSTAVRRLSSTTRLSAATLTGCGPYLRSSSTSGAMEGHRRRLRRACAARDRQIDARLLRPVAGAREALRRKLPFAGASGDQLLPMAFNGVPMRQRLATFSAGHLEPGAASRSWRPAATGVRRAVVRSLRARRRHLPLVLEQPHRLSARGAKLAGCQRFPWLASAPRHSTRLPNPWAASPAVTRRR